MKRVLTVALVVVLCAVMFCVPVSAAVVETNYDLYSRCNDRMTEFKTMEMEMKATMTIQQGGVKTPATMEGVIKQVFYAEDKNMDMQMDMAVTAGDQTINITMYFMDGVAYQNMDGAKTKYPMDFSDVMSISSTINLDFEEDAVNAGEMTKVLGGKRLDFTYKAEDMNALMDSMMDTVMSSMSMSGTKASFSDIKCMMYIGDDYTLKENRMIFGAKITDAKGVVTEANYDMFYKILKYDPYMVISLPADLDSYTLATL